MQPIAIVEASPEEVPRLRENIRQGLMAFNVEHAGPDNYEEIALAARGEAGRLAGGLYGHTAWSWLFVDLLWVDGPLRQRGLGRRLLQAAEAIARARGCTSAYLDTFDFQARPFYERQGYVVYGTQLGYPPGHQRFYLSKVLAPKVPETQA
jgi:GNAT superfamily N-acetyltransferase